MAEGKDFVNGRFTATARVEMEKILTRTLGVQSELLAEQGVITVEFAPKLTAMFVQMTIAGSEEAVRQMQAVAAGIANVIEGIRCDLCGGSLKRLADDIRETHCD